MEKTRKLASIRQVAEVIPIEGADNIELAKVDGWQCVVKKGEFKKGDLGVYFEIDSFLPIQPRYEFLRKSSLRKNCDGVEGFRIKTVRMKKQLSQGLLLPLSEFPELKLKSVHPEDNIGMNLTDILKISKYEFSNEERDLPLVAVPLNWYQRAWKTVKPYIPSLVLRKLYKKWPNFLEQKRTKGHFPYFLQKTDQERIQNLPEIVMSCWDTEFEITQKLDGSSLTAYLKDGKFGVCSRNLELAESAGNKFWQVARKNKLEEVLRFIGKNIALQGEMVGPGIQDNYEGLNETEFYLFDVYDIDKRRHLTAQERIDVLSVANGSLGANLKLVPGAFENVFTLRKFIESCGVTTEQIDEYVNKKVLETTKDEALTPEDFEKIKHYILRSERVRLLIETANGISTLNEKVKREGIVFKSSKLIDDGKVLSFKAISNAYLERGK